MNRYDFQDLADLRLDEAKCLINGGLFEAAYYLAGYAVECGLKACIAKQTKEYDFPPRNSQKDYYTHDFAVLVQTAELQTMLKDKQKAHPVFERYWYIVREWKEDCRYDPRGSTSLAEVEFLLLAIEDPLDGVLTWIRQYW